MAYILRDENRFEEAIAAFTVVIEEGEPNEYTYSERAGLFEKIGDFEKAALDNQSFEAVQAARLKQLPVFH